jgi:glycosyltransferase involved in cell wall biosynthesis
LDPQAFTAPVDTNDVREEFRIPQESKLYINVSRMEKQKNHERLISIFAKIIDDDATARLLLVGRGGNEIERRARACAEEFGIADRIIFAGQRSDVPRLLKAADLMIFPSLREGLPGAVLEACAAGIPVLASDIPGVIEIASHFPSVRHLSLNASDANWAREARSFCKGESTRGGDQPAAPLFGDTVFNMLDCARAHCMVWQGESPSPGPAANADHRKVGAAG